MDEEGILKPKKHIQTRPNKETQQPKKENNEIQKQSENSHNCTRYFNKYVHIRLIDKMKSIRLIENSM